MKVAVIDYGVGNLGSVFRSLEELKVKPVLVDRPEDLHSVDSIILPGVGNFAECAKILEKDGWSKVLLEEVTQREKPILGICLGMQLLASFGFEGLLNKEKEIKKFRDDIDVAFKLLGKSTFFRNKSENKSKIFRRSIFTIKDIKKGEKFSKENIRVIRPGYGLAPKYYNKILNKKSPINILKNEPLKSIVLKNLL